MNSLEYAKRFLTLLEFENEEEKKGLGSSYVIVENCGQYVPSLEGVYLAFEKSSLIPLYKEYWAFQQADLAHFKQSFSLSAVNLIRYPVTEKETSFTEEIMESEGSEQKFFEFFGLNWIRTSETVTDPIEETTEETDILTNEVDDVLEETEVPTEAEILDEEITNAEEEEVLSDDEEVSDFVNSDEEVSEETGNVEGLLNSTSSEETDQLDSNDTEDILIENKDQEDSSQDKTLETQEEESSNHEKEEIEMSTQQESTPQEQPEEAQQTPREEELIHQEQAATSEKVEEKVEEEVEEERILESEVTVYENRSVDSFIDQLAKAGGSKILAEAVVSHLTGKSHPNAPILSQEDFEETLKELQDLPPEIFMKAFTVAMKRFWRFNETELVSRVVNEIIVYLEENA